MSKEGQRAPRGGDHSVQEATYQHAVQGGIKGAALGLGASVPTAYILHQRWPAFRALTLPLKALFVTSATLAAGVISADKSGLAYEAEQYSDLGAGSMKRYASREERQWAQLSPRDKALTWSKENKFAIVAGSWVASMAGVGAYISAQPMSFSQKLVQTRVWAQGLTLASLLGMAAITQIPSAGDKMLEEKHHASDHSWRDFIDTDDGESQGQKPKGQSKGEKKDTVAAAKDSQRRGNEKQEARSREIGTGQGQPPDVKPQPMHRGADNHSQTVSGGTGAVSRGQTAEGKQPQPKSRTQDGHPQTV